MLTLTQARTHALQCGFDMHAYDAVPIEACHRRELAVDIVNPEDGSVLFQKGRFVSPSIIRRAISYGVDYAIVYPV